jgi:hypothetical protein
VPIRRGGEIRDRGRHGLPECARGDAFRGGGGAAPQGCGTVKGNQDLADSILRCQSEWRPGVPVYRHSATRQ